MTDDVRIDDRTVTDAHPAADAPRSRARRHELGRSAGMWTAAAVAAIALWTSGAPSTSYPLYERVWHITATTSTLIFAIYPLTLVVVLLLFGDLSDHIGRRASILLGFAAMFAGTGLFFLAPDVTWLFVGRALMGLGVGLSLSPASAAVVEFSAPGRAASASSITTAGTALGLVFATLVGGFFIQYLPDPLHLDYLALEVAIVAVGAFAWFLPLHVRGVDSRWRPRGFRIPRGIRLLYVTAALSVSVAFMFGSVFLALGASIAVELTGTSDVFVVGTVLALMSACIGAAAILTRRTPPRGLMGMGGVVALVALLTLQASALLHSLPLFIATTVIAGVGYAFLFSGGLGLINAGAPRHHRAGTLSAVYLVSYVLQGLVAVALGMLATASGLEVALDWALLVLGLSAAATSVFAAATRRRRTGTVDETAR